MIGQHKQQAVEYTVYKTDAGYLLECDGRTVGTYPVVLDAHKAAQGHAKANSTNGAGLTEAFGRNRTFVATPRGAWRKFVEVCDD